jgi:hypothetical protein
MIVDIFKKKMDFEQKKKKNVKMNDHKGLNIPVNLHLSHFADQPKLDVAQNSFYRLVFQNTLDL